MAQRKSNTRRTIKDGLHAIFTDVPRFISAFFKAGGITVFIFGGISVVKEAHILDHGIVYMDSILHVETADNPARVSIEDGGVSLKCNSTWTINDFAKKHTNLEPDTSKRPPVERHLPNEVERIARSITKEAPQGDVLIFGSTSPEGIRGAETNMALAIQRARRVKELLERTFGKSRSVLVGNEQLRYSPSGAGTGDGQNTLARLLFGRKEEAGRSVLICVLEPLPRKITIDNTAQIPARTSWMGASTVILAIGIIIGAGIMALVVRLRGENK